MRYVGGGAIFSLLAIMPYQSISHQLHDFLVANGVDPLFFLAMFNDLATHSLNKKEVRAMSEPTPAPNNGDPAPAAKKRRHRKDGDNVGSDGTDGHVTAPMDNNNNDLLGQLSALKQEWDREASRPEQTKKDREKDTKTQKRCGIYICGPSNTVSLRVGQGKGDRKSVV